MPDQITTKPMRSRAQWRWAFANGMPFAKRWARATPGGKGARFRKLPRKVSKKALPIRLKAPNYGARAGQTIAGRLVRGSDGRFSSGGGTSAERLNAARDAARQPKRAAGGGGKRAAPKPKKPVKTPEQRAAERQAEREQERQQREQEQRAERDRILSAAGLDNQTRDALVDARAGDVLAPINGAALAKRGLAEQAKDGSYRLTPAGRQLVDAAMRGDAGVVRDVLSRATDAAAKPAGGGGGGGKKKPEKPPKLPARQTSQTPKPIGGGGGGGAPKQQPERAAQPTTDGALAELAQRLSAGEELSDEEQQTLIRNGLARLVRGELVLTQAGQRATRGKSYELDAGTRRAAAQRVRTGTALRTEVRARHDGAQSTDADRQAGRAPRQGASAESRLKAIVPTRTTDAGHTGVMVALYPDQVAAKAIAGADGVTEPQEQLHLTLCFLGDSSEQPLATNKEKVIDAVAQWATEKGQPLTGVVNGLGRFFHSESDNTNAVYVSPDVPGLPEMRQSLAEWIEMSGFDYSQDHGFTPHITVAYVPEDAPTPPIRVETPIRFDRATLAWGDEQYDFPLGIATKSFQVYKDARGRLRWVAYSSNAYRDRDEEIVSTKALLEDCARADADKAYGPLRWWHVPGWELGDCDFNAMHGRVLVESGTFKSPAIGQAIARKAADLQLSIGFTHAPDEPDRAGVFHHIRRFERSVVPAGRAANPFTRLIVKEFRMDTEKEAALKSALGDEAAQQVLAGAEAVQKDADDRQTAYKSADPWDAVVAALKAALLPAAASEPVAEPEPTAEKADPPMAEDEAKADGMIDTAAVEEVAVEEADPGEMTYDEFVSEIRRVVREEIGAELKAQLAPLAGMLDIEKKVSGAVQSLMQPYQAQKDASDAEKAAEIAALKERLAVLEGDVPRGFRDPLVAGLGGYRATTDDATTTTKEQAEALGLPALDNESGWADLRNNLFGASPTNGVPH